MGRRTYDFARRKKSLGDRIYEKLPERNHWGKIFLVVFVLLSVFNYFNNKTITLTSYPEPTGYFFVEDYSGVLNENTEQYIYDEAAALYHKTKAQVVVVTVPDTQNDDLETFSNHLANKWGIGDAELDNGVLFLIETHETYPHVRLEIGRGLEGAITDGEAGRILDDFAVDAKENKRWNECAWNTFTAVLEKVYEEYGLKAPDSVGYKADWNDSEDVVTQGTFADAQYPDPENIENEEPISKQIYEACAGALITAVCLFGFIVFFFFLVIAMLSDGGNRNGWSDHRSSGSSGGWDSWSSGSGSSSGGGGYSGGGGSFGGGGASR